MDVAASVSAGPRILVVDDFELNCVLTETVLRGAAYEVDAVSDGASALSAMRAGRYDLVLMDLDMPGLDGFAAAAALRRSHGQLARIVALSSRAGAADRERAVQAGMDGHIGRPISPRRLVSEIARLMVERPAPAAPDPWEVRIYEEWAARLGERRVEGYLARLLEQFRALRVLATVATEPSEALLRLAHDVASTGGTLGFLEITRLCRALMEARDGDAARAQAELAAALEGAIARLDAHLSSRGSVAA